MHFQHRKYQEASVYAVLPVPPVLTALTRDLTSDRVLLRNRRKRSAIRCWKRADNGTKTH